MVQARFDHDDVSGRAGGVMNATGAAYKITLTCRRCGLRETFSARKRFMLIMLLEKSMWHSETEIAGTSTCAECHGTTLSFAEHNEIQFEKEQREIAAAKRRLPRRAS